MPRYRNTFVKREFLPFMAGGEADNGEEAEAKSKETPVAEGEAAE